MVGAGPGGSATAYHLARHGVEYVLIDRRLADSVPQSRFYVEPGEFARPNADDPLPKAALSKFDGHLGSDRIYDNGSIQIYDVRALSHAP